MSKLFFYSVMEIEYIIPDEVDRFEEHRSKQMKLGNLISDTGSIKRLL